MKSLLLMLSLVFSVSSFAQEGAAVRQDIFIRQHLESIRLNGNEDHPVLVRRDLESFLANPFDPDKEDILNEAYHEFMKYIDIRQEWHDAACDHEKELLFQSSHCKNLREDITARTNPRWELATTRLQQSLKSKPGQVYKVLFSIPLDVDLAFDPFSDPQALVVIYDQSGRILATHNLGEYLGLNDLLL